jgi:hypothetical protein
LSIKIGFKLKNKLKKERKWGKGFKNAFIVDLRLK